MTTYAGASWIKDSLKYWEIGSEISPLGRDVANLLGELFVGIYHVDTKMLRRVDWSNDQHIEISLGWKSFSTYDSDYLTRLVFLAHHMALRVELSASTHHYVKLLFHRRKRGGAWHQRHPTLDEAVAQFKEQVTFPEYQNLVTP
jgi:hypothetical protein